MAALSLMFQARNFFFYMILIIFMLGFGSCQRSTLSHDSRMPSRFYIDPEQKSSPMEMFGKLDSFDTWKPRLLNQMRNDLGNVWFSVKLPESDHEKVLEFQTLNLIDLEPTGSKRMEVFKPLPLEVRMWVRMTPWNHSGCLPSWWNTSSRIQRGIFSDCFPHERKGGGPELILNGLKPPDLE